LKPGLSLNCLNSSMWSAISDITALDSALSCSSFALALSELATARFYAFAGKDSPASTALIEAARRAGQSRFTPRGLRDR